MNTPDGEKCFCVYKWKGLECTSGQVRILGEEPSLKLHTSKIYGLDVGVKWLSGWLGG